MRNASRIAIGILAAGAARRMAAPKLLIPFKGTTLLENAIRAATGAAAEAVFVITGAYDHEMSSVLPAYPVQPVFNAHWAEGQASSIRTAVAFCREQSFAAVLIMVADQPFVTAQHLDALIGAYRLGKASIYAAQVGNRRGNPCLFDASCFDALMSLTGDTGARGLLKGEGGFELQPVVFADQHLFEDIDTEEDLQRLKGDRDDAC
jgi:molybdenum cofactor cytidylyltransferase